MAISINITQPMSTLFARCKVALAGLLVSCLLTGCASLLLMGGVSDFSEVSQPLSRSEAQQRFGPAVSEGTTSHGRKMEVFAVRVRPEKFFRDTLSTDIRCALIGFHPFCPAWLLIIGPVLAVQERMQANHLQIVFVYGERDEVLYFYDHGSTPADRYEQAMTAMASPFENFDANKCFDLDQCVTEYIEEARRRAGEVGYAMARDEQQMRQFYRVISNKVDEGMITKEASRKIRKPSEYLFHVYRTQSDSLLKAIEILKCPRLEPCVASYVQAMRTEAANAGHTLTAVDEDSFQGELETGKEGDAGKITRKLAAGRLNSIATNRLIRLFKLR